ncbi:hypothetical protein MKW94_023160 [Papaver nudicaule]|uniref:Leucine-rich repeat-containing N-terminal plant-type domain-containing protein n=1 Tax=Papaver nudicaule TaxID=74823 RepID=A0AA41VV29_PAPNU|nr:hypothetical protein [Papaver nudicaule]
MKSYLQCAWLSLFFLAVSVSGSGNSSVQGKCLNDQRDLLLQLNQSLIIEAYDEYDDPFAAKLGTWSLSTDCCTSWEGVICDRVGRVIGLDLSGESISDGLNSSSSLFKLQHLEKLNLAFNSFYLKPIPSGFDQLPNLSYLNLSHSEFTGEIPVGISRLKKLVVLDLTYNVYNPDIPDAIPSNEPRLILRNPDIETLIRNLTELRELLLDGVNISEHGMKWSRAVSVSLPKLQVLSLSDSATNISTDVSDFLGDFPNLTSIHLSDCDLYGTFPESILKARTLQYLHLENNKRLRGSLPELPADGLLQELVLSNTSFAGELPDSVGGLRMLSTLYLQECAFNGSIPASFSKLRQLEELDLSGNSFTGHLDVFFELSNLHTLLLSSNNFNGTMSLPRLFNTLRNLWSLSLSGNKLSITTTSTTNFELFPQVGWLELSFCNLKEFPSFLKNQSKLLIWKIGAKGSSGLGRLNLSYNLLVDPDRPFPPNSFESLSYLMLQSNLLRGKNPILPNPQQAYVLDYSLNNFTSMIPNISSYLSIATFFSHSANQMNGRIPASICDAGYLSILDLSHNNLSGPIPQCLGSMSRLNVLNLRGNNFQGTIPDTFLQACSLKTLNLNQNRFEGQIAKSLANCTMLEVLDVGNNELVGTFPSWLGSMQQLHVLVLRSNHFFGPLGNQRNECNFPTLQIFDVSYNNFSGILSSECFLSWKAMMVNAEEAEWNHKDQILKYKYSYMYYQQTVMVTSKGLNVELVKIQTIFTSIDFSNNGFEGEIPESIGNLTSLYILNFSSNALTGPIPPNFGNLTHVESLDLSHNQLTREIPFQLAGLSFLSVLKLSFNKLVGKIPSGNQFQTFPPSSFEGNDGLFTTIGTSTPKTHAEFDWLLFTMTFLGFVVGAGMVIGPQYFWKQGRQWVNARINRMLNIS